LTRKIKDLIKSFLYLLKPTADLPRGGDLTAVETALNSRCTSDYNGDPQKFHWGIFDKAKKLSDRAIRNIVSMARIPRFTDEKVEIQFERNMLTFVVQSRVSGVLKDWMMVESGMQQQAVGLVCAALGVGMVFRNLGVDGIPISANDHANVRIQLDPMKPSYDGSFWSMSAPAGEKPWVRGNLSDPVRDGQNSLISTLKKLKIENKNGRESTNDEVSQLLWAARGRTPHFYKSKPWGMTIPTAQGKQNISCVHPIFENTLHRYVNWDENRPTHSLEVLGDIDIALQKHLLTLFPSFNCFFLIGTAHTSGIALWELGYQLLNLLLQAYSLGLTYRAALLAETDRTVFSRIHTQTPVVIFAVRKRQDGKR
jgi:hypothetical protein